MKYKALLLDIDNTLYDYNYAHIDAKNSVIEFCKSRFKQDKSIIEEAYKKAREKVHIGLKETAASHNRLLYFQYMCEILGINPLEEALRLDNLYWDRFIENIVPFEGVVELLEMYKNKICLVTDLTAHIQYRKIEKLELKDYCRLMVTSEEAGKEKPHPYMFMLGLQKLGLETSDVCMIGDNFKKDVVGAAALNIDSIWLNHENNPVDDRYVVKQARTFKDILEMI